jgi:predicted SprT family Zn-dependent metalloprotease
MKILHSYSRLLTVLLAVIMTATIFPVFSTDNHVYAETNSSKVSATVTAKFSKSITTADKLKVNVAVSAKKIKASTLTGKIILKVKKSDKTIKTISAKLSSKSKGKVSIKLSGKLAKGKYKITATYKPSADSSKKVKVSASKPKTLTVVKADPNAFNSDGTKYSYTKAVSGLSKRYGIKCTIPKNKINPRNLSFLLEFMDYFTGKFPNWNDKNTAKLQLINLDNRLKGTMTAAMYNYKYQSEHFYSESISFNPDFAMEFSESSKHTIMHEYGHYVSYTLNWITNTSADKSEYYFLYNDTEHAIIQETISKYRKNKFDGMTYEKYYKSAEFADFIGSKISWYATTYYDYQVTDSDGNAVTLPKTYTEIYPELFAQSYAQFPSSIAKIFRRINEKKLSSIPD